MKIQQMFKDDIDRKINGVVKVDQDNNDVLVQELNEYVITKELKKHFRNRLQTLVSGSPASLEVVNLTS